MKCSDIRVGDLIAMRNGTMAFVHGIRPKVKSGGVIKVLELNIFVFEKKARYTDFLELMFAYSMDDYGFERVSSM